MYDYNEMKNRINKELLNRVRNNAIYSQKETLKFNDFTRGIACYDTWELLACIDKLEEERVIRCVKMTGFRQDWEYDLIR